MSGKRKFRSDESGKSGGKSGQGLGQAGHVGIRRWSLINAWALSLPSHPRSPSGWMHRQLYKGSLSYQSRLISIYNICFSGLCLQVRSDDSCVCVCVCVYFRRVGGGGKKWKCLVGQSGATRRRRRRRKCVGYDHLAFPFLQYSSQSFPT